jgi:branched-chain amino acid transport system substrate-binding protein
MGALSGDYASFGRPLRNGVELAVEHANEAGNLACTLEVVTRDTQGEPSQAPPRANALVDRERLVACMCGFFSGETLATGQIFDRAGVLMASTGTNPANAKQGFGTYFRVVANDKDQARSLGRYLRHRWSPRRVALVHDYQEYSLEAMRAIRRTLGWRVEIVEKIDPERQRYGAAVRRIEHANADLVVYTGYAPQAARLLLQLRRAGIDVPFATNGGVEDGVFTSMIRRGRDGMEVDAVGSCACNSPARIPGADAFTAAYRERFDKSPRLFAGDMYDVTNFVIDLLETRSGTDEVSELRSALVTHFDEMEGGTGLIKRYTWEINGELRTNDRHTFIYRWRNGDWRMRGSAYNLMN